MKRTPIIHPLVCAVVCALITIYLGLAVFGAIHPTLAAFRTACTVHVLCFVYAVWHLSNA